MRHRKLMLTGLCAMVLGACQGGIADVSRLSEPDLSYSHSTPPPGSRPGACWGKDVTPAVVESVTEQVLMQPAQVTVDGQITSPALYKTETQQRIVKERREIWFEVPCPPVMDQEFVVTLQRALKARGHYRGAINGAMDSATRRAVRRYQAPQGLDSSILSLAAARKLGLVDYGF